MRRRDMRPPRMTSNKSTGPLTSRQVQEFRAFANDPRTVRLRRGLTLPPACRCCGKSL
ncbi:hypothetical protein L829_1854 [Mycobacteroides abscessus MAB_030201_1075]|uniref:Uncharacterized protein n=2 Tax=Mycobacteroides abscessus TaxID=36809 RepID=A0A829PJQ6_9MYCO|nr:hypothetical protein L835_3849 [Mycobacteroides abscessus MAB_110811_1470]ETZ88295.1 hypothetical protein L829_1854 [Mycobacteroides abscessus MAB_030201_1075]EUA82578.1 hypothetical protein I544_3901 [Mycobacteroides abscessus subsp. bolletii 103]